MTIFGLTKEIVKNLAELPNSSITWRLTSQPTIQFYIDLHQHLKAFKLSQEQIGRLYRKIDPWLEQTVQCETNAYRKIAKLCHHDHPSEFVQYFSPPSASGSPSPPTPTLFLEMLPKGRKGQKIKSCLYAKNFSKSLSISTKHNSKLGKMQDQLTSSKQKLTEEKQQHRQTYKQKQELTQVVEAQKATLQIYKSKLGEMKQRIKELTETMQEMEVDAEEAIEEIQSEYSEQVEELHTQLEASANVTIKTKEKNQYNPRTRALYYKLLSRRIPPGQIKDTIQDVVATLVPSAEVSKLELPSSSCAEYLRRDEITVISRAHKASTLGKAKELHLNSDGTTLHQQKKGATILNGIVLGVHDVYDGSAAAALEDLEVEIEAVNQMGKELGEESEMITLDKVVSSTSDGASTQGKLNKLIQEKRGKEAVFVENKCAMHLGQNLRLAEIAGLQAFTIESEDDDEATATATRERTPLDNFVHAAAKLIGHTGGPEYGHGVVHFREFLERKATQVENLDHNYYTDACMTKLKRQVGSRYHVTARNAGRLFFLAPAIEEFLQEVQQYKPQNRLVSLKL